MVHNIPPEQNDILRVASMLETLPHIQPSHRQNHLLEIVLAFSIVDIDVFKVPLLPWSDLADILAQLNMSGNLKRVRFIFARFSTFREPVTQKYNDMDDVTLCRILDRNPVLKALRQKRIITCNAL